MAGEIAEKAAKKAVEKVPSWIERLLMPKLSTIEGELTAIHTRIDSVEAQIGSMRNETKIEIEGIGKEIESNRKEMLSKFETVDTKITSLDERIISLRNETKMEIASLRNEMKSEFTGMNYRFDAINTQLDSLEKRIPVIEEITALKIKIAEIEKRLAVA